MNKLAVHAIEERLKNMDGWDFVNNSLEATFMFENFKDAFSTMTRIAFECEAQNHHPDWTNVYKHLTIRLSTHDAQGITEKDFKLAAAIDKIIASE